MGRLAWLLFSRSSLHLLGFGAWLLGWLSEWDLNSLRFCGLKAIVSSNLSPLFRVNVRASFEFEENDVFPDELGKRKYLSALLQNLFAMVFGVERQGRFGGLANDRKPTPEFRYYDAVKSVFLSLQIRRKRVLLRTRFAGFLFSDGKLRSRSLQGFTIIGVSFDGVAETDIW